LEDGTAFYINGVFTNSSFGAGSFDEWNNKKVLVAIDKTSERIVVLKKNG